MAKPAHRSGQEIYRYVVRPVSTQDPRSNAYLADAHALGLTSIEQILCHDLFFVEGSLSPAEIDQLAGRLLSDSLTQEIDCETLAPGRHSPPPRLPPGQHHVEVALHPGVTDPVAEQIVRAAHELGLTGVRRASTGQRFLVNGARLDEETLRQLALRLLANPTIQRYALGEIEPIFPGLAQASAKVEQFAVRDLDRDGLLALSYERRAALDEEEVLAIQRYFQAENRDMTDIEFETIAQTWSEHCVHKTFKARITIQNPGSSESPAYRGETHLDNLLKTYLRAATEKIDAPWVRSAFVDNAGIIDFDDRYEVSFKVETHNHPSAIEPFGGANTGVGGVIRDVIGVSAKPIAATDVLCFGPPDTPFDDLPAGVLHPRRIRSGVVAGVQDYGNKIGLPTVSGAILYDPGFTANPLVFCGCVGIAPKGSHPRTPHPGDRVIVLGGRTGRDGLRGATFSSMTMDAQTGEVAGASVQIGAPIVEKGLIDVILQARDERLYSAITDCGAGGLSSAVGEMASVCGAEVELQHVRLKYPGLAPWEIWLSEAQERMVLAVPPTALPRLEELCRVYAVELTDIGAFTATGRLVVSYAGRVVLDLSNKFLHEGIPQRRLSALLPGPEADPLAAPQEMVRHPEHSDRHPERSEGSLLPVRRESGRHPERNEGSLSSTSVVIADSGEQVENGYTQILCDLLAHPNIASKEQVIRLYDHEVQGGTVVKPLTGAMNDGPSDAVVLKPAGTSGATALVLGAGINAMYGKRSPYRMALSVVDEALRNAVAVGADPGRVALLDNFCWGDPRSPETLGGLVEACRGCYDAAVTYGTPFISGKDSLNNEYLGKDGRRHAIPPTLLISSIGILPDLNRAVTMDLKQPGNSVYLVGAFEPTLAGSHLSLLTGQEYPGRIPGLPQDGPAVYRALHAAIQARLVRACHDLSEGGLAVAAAEMCIGGRFGLALRLDNARSGLQDLFGETNGCLLVEVSSEDAAAFETLFTGLPLRRLGQVTAIPELTIYAGDGPELLSVPVDRLIAAWQSTGGR